MATRLYTFAEAGKFLGVSEGAVAGQVTRYSIKPMKVGRTPVLTTVHLNHMKKLKQENLARRAKNLRPGRRPKKIDTATKTATSEAVAVPVAKLEAILLLVNSLVGKIGARQ